jgi:hypothetical protein
LPNLKAPDVNLIIGETRGCPLLKLTLGELRAGVALCHTGKQKQAVRLTGYDTSRLRRAATAVDRQIMALAKEDAFIKEDGTYKEVGLTASGCLLDEHARQILWHVFQLSEELKKPRPVRLALTTYTTQTRFAAQILQEAQRKLGDSIALRHIASDDVVSLLKGQAVDFAFSGVLAESGRARDVDSEIDFRPLANLRMGLLSNYKIEPTPNPRQLLLQEKDSLMPPTHGIFLEVLTSVLSESEVDNLRGFRSDNIQFPLDLLRLKLLSKACIVVDEELARIVSRSSKVKLFFSPFRNSVTIQAGVFRLKERSVPGPPTQAKTGSGQGDAAVQAFENILEKHTLKFSARR